MAVGFIGLGNMGKEFALRLAGAGYELHVLDADKSVRQDWSARGFTVWDTPAEVASAAEVVFLSLPEPSVVETVSLGSAGVRDGSRVKYLIDLSTTGPDMALKLAAELAESGITLVDAPVSGGVAGAKAGTVAIMLACSEVDKQAILPLLEQLGRVFHVGEQPGLGQVAKVLNNTLSAGYMLLAGEAAALGVKAGLDPKSLIDVFNAGSGRSSATLDKYPKAILPGSFDLGFSNRLMFKDVGLCLRLAEQMGIELPVARSVGREWQAAMMQEGEDADFSTIVRKAERECGVEVRARRNSIGASAIPSSPTL
ncbi:NAD(P)-dependent oxidoreductase [Tsuneonella sp. HG222]